MTRRSSEPRANFGRRSLLKSAAAGGAVITTEAVSGFPTVWAQNTKDVTLVHAGGSYAAIKEIGDQASKDLGFKIVMQAITDDVQLNRSLTQPASIDINNIDSAQQNYSISGSVFSNTAVPWTDGGVKADFTLTSADTYSVTLSGLVSGVSQTLTGALQGTSGATIDSIALYNETELRVSRTSTCTSTA